MNLADLMTATQRQTLSSVVVRRDTIGFGSIDRFAASRLDLEIVALPEDVYYGQLDVSFFANPDDYLDHGNFVGSGGFIRWLEYHVRGHCQPGQRTGNLAGHWLSALDAGVQSAARGLVDRHPWGAVGFGLGRHRVGRADFALSTGVLFWRSHRQPC